MALRNAPLALDEDQVLWFRARRLHLAPPGALDAAAAARAALGVQSQQIGPSLLGLSQRTKGRPTAAALERELFEAPRSLVRTWGQRDTLHVYDPATDWAAVVAARQLWAAGGRRGAMPAEAAVDKARAVLLAAEVPISRKDVAHLVSAKVLREIEIVVGAGPVALGHAAGRLIWRLAQRGEACMAARVGSAQAYAARTHWFPGLAWPAVLDPLLAAVEHTRRYLAGYGPATAADLAHFFGAHARAARQWLEVLEKAGALLPVACGARKGLFALQADRKALAAAPPTSATAWPLRLLPMWDGYLMGNADKSWTVADAADGKRVWRKAAVVAAVALWRGRAVANWSHSVKGKRLRVQVEPLSGWRQSKHAAGLRREAKAVAAHLGLEGAEVAIDSG